MQMFMKDSPSNIKSVTLSVIFLFDDMEWRHVKVSITSVCSVMDAVYNVHKTPILQNTITISTHCLESILVQLDVGLFVILTLKRHKKTIFFKETLQH